MKRFCQACPTCQRTSLQTPPPSPLIPLPIIEVPFERIGMDLIGPLPKSARGHEHILVIVDYATRYPEAVPLRKATPAKAIALERFLLWQLELIRRSQLRYWIDPQWATPVHIPAKVLTFCRLMKSKQLRHYRLYHLPNGWMSRTVQPGPSSKMLCRVAAEAKFRLGPEMLPYVLFGIREVPQASTGFTPFELLFRPANLGDSWM